VDEHYKNAIYNMLSSSYKENKNITLNDIEKLYGEVENAKIFLNQTLEYSISNNTTIYFVEGESISYKNFDKNTFKIAVIINIDTSSFEILPWDYVEQIGWNNLKIGDKIDIKSINHDIKKNQYNTFKYQNSTNESIAREYFDNYQFNLLHNKEAAYRKLNEEYSKAKFNNLEEFENYIRNNIIAISKGKINKYQTAYRDGYTQYVCVDNNERYYIFKVKSVLDYEVILDTYTIDIPEFTNKYNASNNQEKVILNLNKFNLSLNDKDYKTAYNMLADSFKAKNFPTLAAFEKYIKENLFEENKFEYTEFGDEAGTYYTYSVNIADATSKSNKKVNKKFIMLLEEGTEFKLSFNI